MKSQQTLTNFMKSRAKYSCRMYFCNSINKDDMTFDVMQNERYYHETTLIREEENIATLTRNEVERSIIKKLREKFFSKHDMLIKPSILQHMTFDLNIICSKSEDSAHNEFFKIVRRIMSILCQEILLSKALEKFSKRFRIFFFLAD